MRILNKEKWENKELVAAILCVIACILAFTPMISSMIGTNIFSELINNIVFGQTIIGILCAFISAIIIFQSMRIKSNRRYKIIFIIDLFLEITGILSLFLWIMSI